MRPIWSHHSDAGPFGAYSVGLRFDAIQPLVKEIELAGSVLIENILDMKIVGGAGDPKLIDHVSFTSDAADNVTGADRPLDKPSVDTRESMVIDALLHLDALARDWVVMHRLVWLNGPLWLLSAIARGGLLFLAIAGVAALVRRRLSTLVPVALAIALATLLADHVLKPLIQRRRPFVAAPAVHVIGGKPDDPSLPSGHAANAFAGAATLSRVVPEGAAIWWGLAIAVAYSRVYLGVHYPADVIAGAIVGLCSGFIGLAVSDAVGRRRPDRTPTTRGER